MEDSNRKAIRWLMMAVAAWGGLIALGVFLPARWDWSQWNWHDAVGALIVLAMTGLLLLTWHLFLKARERRSRR